MKTSEKVDYENGLREVLDDLNGLRLSFIEDEAGDWNELCLKKRLAEKLQCARGWVFQVIADLDMFEGTNEDEKEDKDE